MNNDADNIPLALLTVEDAIKGYQSIKGNKPIRTKEFLQAFEMWSIQYLSELCLFNPREIENFSFIGPKTFFILTELLKNVFLPPIGTFDQVIGNNYDDKRTKLIESSVDIFESIKAGVAKPVDTPFIAAQVNAARKSFRKAAMPEGDNRSIEINYLQDVRIAAARAELHIRANRLALA